MRRPTVLPRSLRAFALLLGVLSVFPLPGSAQADRPEIKDLTFRGNRSFSDGVLESAIVATATSCKTPLEPFCWLGMEFAVDRHYLNPREFRRDLARIKVFYYQRGYREAQVDTVVSRPSEDEVRITFEIEEGRPVLVDSIAMVGLEDLADPELLEDLPLRVEDPLNGLVLDAVRDTLLSRLRNRGYAHADVLRSYFIPSERPYRAEVTFDAYTGPLSYLGPVEVVGNEEVSETVVRRMLPFGEGDLYEQEVLFQGQRNLFRLEIFSNANISQDLEHQPDSVVPIRVQVNEGDVHRVRTGVGWSTADCLNTEARWASRNFLGGARRLQVRARLTNVLAHDLGSSACVDAGTGDFANLDWLVSSDFTQPWIFSPRNSLSAGLFAERQSVPDVFIRKGVGGSVALARSLGGGTSVTLDFRPQLASLEAAEIFFCTTFLVCDPEEIGLLEDPNWLSPLGVALARDRTDRPINPTSGYTALLGFELARSGTLSDFRYERAVGEATFYTQPAGDLVLAFQLRGGWLNPRSFGGLEEEAAVAHPQKRFLTGGANSVRGFAQNQLGPRVLTVGVEELLLPGEAGPAPCTPTEVMELSCDAAPLPDGAFDSPRPTGGSRLLEGSAEARFPLGLWGLQAATFVDFGQVWSEGTPLSLGELEFTPGFGVRYPTPIGPFRVDVAYRFRSGEDLQVVTRQILPFDPENHEPDQRIGAGDEVLPFVRSGELAPLGPRVAFGESGTFDLSRFQLHISIGQAF